MSQNSPKRANKDFIRGLTAGIPIGLGYLSVSFSFGIMAVSTGFTWWQALVVSMLCVTSAGQFAGIGVMMHPGLYFDMLLSQLTINIRYSFMSISLSQKTDSKFGRLAKWLMGFMMTDEVFAVAVNEDCVSRAFFGGLISIPYIGWSVGTLCGALLGNILPASVMNALCIALYGMFVAIVTPATIKNKATLFVVAIAIVLSCIIYYSPLNRILSSGLSISICAIAAAAAGALLFPVSESESDEHDNCGEPTPDGGAK